MLLLEVSSHLTYLLTAPGTASRATEARGLGPQKGVGHPSQAKGWEPGDQPWRQGGLRARLVPGLAASLINSCFLEEGERKVGKVGAPLSPFHLGSQTCRAG